MKREFRAHPLMLMKYVKPFLFVLVIPVLKGVYQYIRYKAINDVLGLEMFIFAAVVAFGILRCISFKLICDSAKQTVTIKTGILFVKKAVLSVSKLSSVQTEQNPIDAVFRAVTYRINTEAGKKGSADFEFKLSCKDSKRVSAFLYGKSKSTEIRFSPIKIAILAATTSSAFTGMVVGVPVINKTGNLLGIALSEMLFDEINNVSSKFQTYFPPIVNTVSLIILLSYAISFVYSFFKYINFKLFVEDGKLEIRSGFFIRTRTAFKKESVKNVRIEQTVLMMLFRHYSMKVSIGGYGDAKSESEVIIPAGRHGEIKSGFRQHFPFLEPDGEKITAKRNNLTKSRFLTLPAVYFAIILVSAIILEEHLGDFTRLIVFLTVVICCIIACYAYLCLFEYKHGTVTLGNNVFAQSRKGLRTCEFYCPKENIGEIKLIRYPPDYWHKTCRIKISVRSESADSILVRHLDYETVKNEVHKNFNINV